MIDDDARHLRYDGHGKPCARCKELCNGFSGNPSYWPVTMFSKTEKGKAAFYHMGCLADIIDERDKFRADIDKYRERLEVDHVWKGSGQTTELTREDIPYTGFENEISYDGIDCRDETIKLLEGK
jgi:hypothetical protein